MKQISRKSLAEEVAETIKYKIKKGILAVNSKLPSEPELMKDYGVGRSSIREAIKILAQSGFVNVRQGLGTFVISSIGNDELIDKIQQANFTDIFEVRQILEFKIIEKSVQNRTEESIVIIEKHLNDRLFFAESGDLIQCVKADVAFHAAIANSCGNSILAALYKTLSSHVETFFSEFYTDTTPFLRSQDLHRDLFHSIKNQDAEKALAVAFQIIGGH